MEKCKIILLICSLIAVLLFYGCTQKTTYTNENSIETNTPISTQIITKDEAIEKLKEFLKEKGKYDPVFKSYKIESPSSLNELRFSVYYDTEEDHITLSGSKLASKQTAWISLYPQKTTILCSVLSTILSDKDYVVGYKEIDISCISNDVNKIEIDKYSRLTDEANNTSDKDIKNNLSTIGAAIIKQILYCYEYEQDVQGFPVTLEMLGFTNFK